MERGVCAPTRGLPERVGENKLPHAGEGLLKKTREGGGLPQGGRK